LRRPDPSLHTFVLGALSMEGGGSSWDNMGFYGRQWNLIVKQWAVAEFFNLG
jgi:hypothetical protein